jgi:hypothetical protein
LASEVALVCVLWRSGQRDWWTAYLLFDVLRGLALRQLTIASPTYFWAWLITEVLSLGFQFVAVGILTRGAPLGIGMAIGAGALAWSIVLTSEAWPTGRRAALMLRQAGSFGCTGALLAAASIGRVHRWLLAYYAMRVFRGIVEQFAITRERVETVNLAALLCSAALFLAWSISETLSKRRINPS